MMLKQGESSKANVVFDTKGSKGNQLKTVKVYSNDPKNPMVLLVIKANFIEDAILKN